eukprot:CAMPEP_0179931610 /NCGR_PEP_ID=MMETSP0983-20121128/10761_1 /TAXON_ID=483367 /ORGANISM="non described non described, Strain CCMP 2436" /LENGTH=116 /DNA_ID=CAMNT_0021836029 /DNA_START=375 /DNA_END=725 /DNA_ORIENTATION=+
MREASFLLTETQASERPRIVAQPTAPESSLFAAAVSARPPPYCHHQLLVARSQAMPRRQGQTLKRPCTRRRHELEIRRYRGYLRCRAARQEAHQRAARAALRSFQNPARASSPVAA